MRRLTEETIKKMRELRKKGLSLREISKNLNVSKFSVYTYTKDMTPDIKKEYSIPGLGQLKLKTIATLMEKGLIQTKLSENFAHELEKYDAVIVDDKGSKILIKGLKKIMEI